MRLENRIPPPLLFLMTGVGMWAGSRGEVGAAGAMRVAMAGLLGLAGVLIAVAGIVAFRRMKTTIDPVRIERASSLVTQGVFRYTRNPMYVGMTTVLAGWGVWLGVAVALLGPIGFALFIHRFQILPEERAMRAKFGAAYFAYCGEVRRWV